MHLLSLHQLMMVMTTTTKAGAIRGISLSAKHPHHRLHLWPVQPLTCALARCDLHAWVQGAFLASASGDACIKLWSFAKQKCVATYKAHTQAVWGVAWHHEGNFLASCSLDQSLRIWDYTNGQSRQILR